MILACCSSCGDTSTGHCWRPAELVDHLTGQEPVLRAGDVVLSFYAAAWLSGSSD